MPELQRIGQVMEQTIGDSRISLVGSGKILESFTAHRYPARQISLANGLLSQLDHRPRRINSCDATIRQGTGQSNGNIARPAAKIKHMPLGKLREVFSKQLDEALILCGEIRLSIGRGLQRIIHEFRLKNP
ncbi:hypothetical protein NITLEN_10300 [Nitrospira lenta]|uniref:Uncharacterized protein n=1 Tax=Nitrospira lenta TaxID=1436998 RepID=A0A330L0N7_9BACT|nr:hypothetical protein NITLEN_10300 [Nitrospira lenta]